MEKRETKRYARAAAQVERTRRLYAQIGEPLPVEIIIDLHHHLGAALEAVEGERQAMDKLTRRRKPMN